MGRLQIWLPKVAHFKEIVESTLSVLREQHLNKQSNLLLTSMCFCIIYTCIHVFPVPPHTAGEETGDPTVQASDHRRLRPGELRHAVHQRTSPAHARRPVSSLQTHTVTHTEYHYIHSNYSILLYDLVLFYK